MKQLVAKRPGPSQPTDTLKYCETNTSESAKRDPTGHVVELLQRKGEQKLGLPKQPGEEHISCYAYNTHQPKHYFCPTCGIHPFYQPRSNSNARDISLQCLDGGTVQKIDIVSVKALDWKNWEKYLKENPEAANYTDNVE